MQHLGQSSLQPDLFQPGPPIHDEATAQTLRTMVTKGAVPPLVPTVADCHAAYV